MSEQSVTPIPYNHIFETCLKAIQDGRATIDTCVERFPEYAPDLEQDLQLALRLAQVPSPMMQASAVDALESKLMAQFDVQTAPTPVNVVSFPAQRRVTQFARKWVAVFVMMIFFAMAGTGTTVAMSASSMPGDSLYTVKRAWESVVVVLAQIFGNVDDVWLQIAETRFIELEYVLEEELDFDALVNDLADAINQSAIFADADTQARLMTFVESSRTTLNAKFNDQINANNNSLIVLDTVMQTVSSGESFIQQPIPDSTPTREPSPTVELSETLLPSATPTMIEPSPTEGIVLVTLAPTETPMIPATATLTPTQTPTMTIMPSITPATMEPTATLTPLPLRPSVTPLVPSGSDNTIVTLAPNATQVTGGDSGDGIFDRQTPQAVFMTQTAIADPNVTQEPTPNN